jgi:hypothetical protein
MKLDLLITQRRHIIPATPEDAEKLRSLPSQTIFPVVVNRPRNGDHHRFFMAVVALVAENHPSYDSTETLLRELKYRTHHFDEYVTRGGAVIYEMRSISYSEMDEGDFTIWSNKALDVLFGEIWPEVDQETVKGEARRQMAEWERSR